MKELFKITISVSKTDNDSLSFDIVGNVNDEKIDISTSQIAQTTQATQTNNDLENKHPYVDLGLPSGLKWATYNVGAHSPEELGRKFSWGGTVTRLRFNGNTYEFNSQGLTKYCNDTKKGKDGFTDNLTQLELEDDAAHMNWGGKWRMPTKEDFEELIQNTHTEFEKDYKDTGVPGIIFTAFNGNRIFLPCVKRYKEPSDCHYWSSLLDIEDPSRAYLLYISRIECKIISDYRTVSAHYVRPVCL